MVTVAPGKAAPVCASVTFPERESCAAAKKGSSKAKIAVNKIFNVLN